MARAGKRSGARCRSARQPTYDERACLLACVHGSSVADMQEIGVVAEDVTAVRDFVSQVRLLCVRLAANPFNTAAGEALLELVA